jgi:type VI secretion system protein ImpC
MSAPQQAAGEAATTTEAVDGAALLEQITKVAKLPSGADAEDKRMRQRGLEALNEFIDSLVEPGQVVSADFEKTVHYWIAEIDRKMSDQLSEIMHAPQFQQLESTWRGLHYLIMNSETGEKLKIRVINATKRELLRDLEGAAEFDQSQLFKKIYEEEYGILGGHPFGLLIGDYDFDVRRAADVGLLKGMAGIAAAAHAPFVSAVSPKAFNMDSFTEMPNPRDLAKIFDNVDFAPWKSFREAPDSRYVALTMPRVLARYPYGEKYKQIDEFNYEEDVDGTDHHKYLWMNSAWAFGTRVTDAFAKYGWLACIRGVEGGGKVEGLPVCTFKTDDGDVAMKCPTEVAITERRENELSGLGFLPLIHCKGRDFAAFIGSQSCQKPDKYEGQMGDYATANAALSAKINLILCVSRFAHYLKVMIRDKVGKFMEREDLERWLNQWINCYTVDPASNPSDEMRAKYPLASAVVEVKSVPGQPGYYRAVARLRPHFQLEGVDMSLRLVAQQLSGG